MSFNKKNESLTFALVREEDIDKVYDILEALCNDNTDLKLGKTIFGMGDFEIIGKYIVLENFEVKEAS
jgi:hypothetical protein